MAKRNASSKRVRPSTRNKTSKHPETPPVAPPLPYDPNVTNTAVTTLVHALLTALRQTLSFAYVAASALKRQNFDLGSDVAATLTKALGDELSIDLRQLEQLLTYVHRDCPRARAY